MLTHRFFRVVAKVGTTSLTAGGDTLDAAAMRRLAAQIVQLRAKGIPVVLVTSGAVAAGRERLGVAFDSKDLPAKQALAAVGQAILMQRWDSIFREHSVVVAQALLTRQDLSQRQGYLNARTTLLTLLEHQVLPIINENDVVAVDEIKIGDNDQLSALVANLIDADLLVLLTDTGGLYTADPRSDPTATLIPLVENVDANVERLAGKSTSRDGTGGMRTKLLAARTATRAGASVIIASGAEPPVLLRAVQGEPIGTLFPAKAGVDGRRRWLATGVAGRGELLVDAGAERALLSGGKSLLPAGIRQVQGRFARGDALLIRSETGQAVACGLSNYDARDLTLIAGRRSDEIAAMLGYTFGPEAVHRNNLVVL
ncbi:MAG: glutamate 5-kinase [Chloroflexota bacterium]